jgi:hypothetical protein
VSNDEGAFSLNIFKVLRLSVSLFLKCFVAAKYMWTIGFQNEGSEEELLNLLMEIQ